MTTDRLHGPFDVTLTPLPPAEAATERDGAGREGLGRMAIDKRYHGDLDATGRGEMLSALTDVKGSAGYVALERVTGTIRGRRGSFVLQHSGTMDRGAKRLTVTVVPDSATDQLEGLAGALDITITDGRHFYTFDYTLP